MAARIVDLSDPLTLFMDAAVERFRIDMDYRVAILREVSAPERRTDAAA